MKLTCTCGASIETDVPEFKLAMQTTLGEPRTIVDRFKADHAPCLEHWRAELHRSRFTPYVAHLFPYTLDELQKRASYGQTINHTMKPIMQPRDQAIKGICCHCGSATVYRRIDGITVICYSCGKFNVEPTDPYQRFRAAIRDGKRVFIISSGWAHTFDPMPLLGPVDEYFIEGVDIPTQPTQEWLDKSGLELVGCRLPKRDERFAGVKPYERDEIGISSIDQRPDFCVDGFSGRRWIVKRKETPEEILRKMKDIDACFNTWWESYGKCMTNDRTPHEMAWRNGFRTGQKAKP